MTPLNGSPLPRSPSHVATFYLKPLFSFWHIANYYVLAICVHGLYYFLALSDDVILWGLGLLQCRAALALIQMELFHGAYTTETVLTCRF